MYTVKVILGKRSYNILTGSNIINNLGESLLKLNIGRDAYVITNTAIRNRYGISLEKTLKAAGFNLKFRAVADSEKSKSIKTATSVINDLAGYDKKRKVFIIAFGGGVIGDLSGFVASIYKRGIPYVQIPTTLLAQVDSSIGGKTAIDLTEGKNLVGAFYQPRLVFSDVALLKSLNKRQICAGLSEVIKYALIKNHKLFAYLEDNYNNILKNKEGALKFIVERCSRIKAYIVAVDEREEKGIRTILNFGHTVGHAIEAACRYNKYNHGEAVALGMLAAARISLKLKLIDEKLLNRITGLVKAVGLPVKIKNVAFERIINAHYRDKKFIGSKNRFVLITGIGRTKIVENIPIGIIKEALWELI